MADDATDDAHGRHARHDDDPRSLGLPRRGDAAHTGSEAPSEPEGDDGPRPPRSASRKPTIENRRPVDLYHEGRHIRERIREQGGDVTSEIPAIDAPIRESAHEQRGAAAAAREPAPATAFRQGPAEQPAEPDTPGLETDSNEPSVPAPEIPGQDQPGRRRLVAAFWPPRVTRAQLVGAILLFALGAGLAIQVRSTTSSDPLRGARQEDLVRVLDELRERTQRLEDEKHRLESSRTQLQNSNDRVQEAREQNEAKADALGVLAGTVKAVGPGITLTINDPQRAVTGDVLLDTLQELRAAGAEVIQINDVRVVASTWLSGTPPGDVLIDGTRVQQPYVFEVIGNPLDLEPALNIPGGVIKTLEKKQAGAVVAPSQEVHIDALRPANKPRYARSAPGADNG